MSNGIKLICNNLCCIWLNVERTSQQSEVLLEYKENVMHTNHIDKYKMPFFDTLKTAATVGLLMQQVSAMPCNEGVDHVRVSYSLPFSEETSAHIASLMMNEALDFISSLTTTLNRAYSLLLESKDNERSRLIDTLDPEKTDLIELQLRGLEGAIRNVYKDCTEEKKALLKNPLLVTAKARASASKLNHLISQMSKPVQVFHSNIDMEGLRALAKHGTEVFVSGKFH